ncbi:sensor domain-containing protein [Nocardioides sp. T2.26MG-1]|uniref:sensor domain-containing protein n=1 Tax=Nocardioides sp. T2.26MG-1 TaxID=3041166 RepID=UPI0024775CAF|nr:PAS domain S-box protein [Nocardioides sp. T2.26MG-1]CAI9409630.1 putative diguanylate cyclase DgcE [Nocardioides sp. T2.26MG-1]
MREIDQGQLLASIAATSHDCILSLDTDAVIAWASPAIEQVLGWRAGDLAGRGFAVLFPGDGGDRRDAAVAGLLAGDRVEPYIDQGLRRDGSTFTAQVTLGPVRGPDDVITGVVVILRDVTAQLHEQRELALALEMSRAHFDQATTPQAILDLHGHLESVNPAWCELFGHGEGWFADCEVVDLVDPVDAEDVLARFERLGAGEIDSISYRGLFRDSEDRELSLVLDAALLREPGGRPYAIAASVGDLDDGDDLDGWLGRVDRVGPEVDHGDRAVGDDDTADPDVARVRITEALARRAWETAVVMDRRLRIVYVSGALARLLRLPPEDVLLARGPDFLHPSDARAVGGLRGRLLAEPRSAEHVVMRVRDGEQRWRWMEITATNCLDDPEIGGIVANLRDVTERVRTEEALRLSEALHRAMVETAQEGIMATSPEGKVMFTNETAADIVGRTVEELYGADPRELFGFPELRSAEEVASHEVVHLRPDGSERILEVSRRPLNSRNGHLGSLVSVYDVTDARLAERALRRRALHDPVTSLPNRYLFFDRLETAAARQRRFEGRGTAVLFVDLDEFKQVNDGFGHEAGDTVLREVAERMLASVRGTDTVGRLGGDEFAVICEDTGIEEALVVAQRILDACREPVRVGGRDHVTSLSIGIAVAPPYGFDELVRRADEAMYRAKQRGGGRVGVADQDPGPGSEG